MPLYLIEGPSQPVVSVVAMMEHSRIEFGDDADLIDSYIAAAVQNLDGRDGWLGRALVSQRWELRLAGFNACEIPIPLPPLIEVESIVYQDKDDVAQMLSSDVYEVVGVGGFAKARVVLKDGERWPATAKRAEPVSIAFRAGYVDTASSPAVGEIPAPIATAIKRMVATFYENRESIIVGAPVSSIPSAVEALLAPYRVW